jgi:hypothetical protein
VPAELACFVVATTGWQGALKLRMHPCESRKGSTAGGWKVTVHASDGHFHPLDALLMSVQKLRHHIFL